jgi:hypothetical protein
MLTVLGGLADVESDFICTRAAWSASNKVTNATPGDKLTFYSFLLKERPNCWTLGHR